MPCDASVTDAGVLCYEAAALLEAVPVRRGTAQKESSANTAVWRRRDSDRLSRLAGLYRAQPVAMS